MKMTNLIKIAAALVVASSVSYASFQPSFATVNGTFYDLNATTANADFQGANLGTFDINTDQILLGAEMNITGGNVQFSRISWAVFDSDNNIVGSFVDTNGTFDSVHFGNDRWVLSGGSRPDILSGLTGTTGGTDYTLHVNLVGDYNPGGFGFTEDNGGSNFIADFTVVPEPSTYAALAGLFGLAFVALNRRRA